MQQRVNNKPSDSVDDRVRHVPPTTKPVVSATRGRLVTFYRNGDPHFKGLQTSVSRRLFATFDTLASWLAEKLSLSGGVRYIFALPDGRPITELSDFARGHSYVASSVPKIEDVSYGSSKEQFWHNRTASANIILNRVFLNGSDVNLSKGGRKNTEYPYSYPSSRINSFGNDRLENLKYVRYGLAKPRMLVIRSNTHRSSQQKVLFNLRTVQPFEDLLLDVTRALDFEYPPVTSLYTAKPPFRKVMGISHLVKGLRNHYEFLACGRELVPLELLDHIQPPLHDSRQPQHQRSYRLLSPKVPSRPLEKTEWPDDDSPAPKLRHQKPGADPWRQRHYRLTSIDDQGQGYEPQTAQQLPVFHSSDITPPQYEETEDGSSIRRLFPYDSASGHSNKEDRTRPYNRKTMHGTESIKVEINGTLKEFFAPRYGKGDLSRPDRKPKLEWVYGYQGSDARNNLHVLPSGEVIYYVAGIGVVYDRKNHRQTHYLGHNSDISCIALHPDKRHPIAATGQVTGRTPESKSQIRIWDPFSMNTLTILDIEDLQDSVTSVDFSIKNGDEEEGRYLLALDNSEQHNLRIWEWRIHVFLAKTATSSSAVIGGTFNPKDHSIIVTFGEYHVYFWKFFVADGKGDREGRILRDKQSGIFETDISIPKFVTALTFGVNGDVIAGTSEGDIIVWSRDASSAYVINSLLSQNLLHAHQRPVASLCVLSGGTVLSAGGSEMKSWDSMNNYTLIQTKLIPERAGSIGTIAPRHPDARDGILYLGTTSNNILHETLNDFKYSYSVQGHKDELFALAAHPVDPAVFVSAGCDSNVSQWHSRKHRIQWRVQVEKPCLSVTFHPSGRLIVIGTMAGRFIVLESTSGDYVTSVQAGSEPIEAIKFAPDGRFLALGSHDNLIYVFSVTDNGRTYQRFLSGVLEGHRSKVTNVDWSKDGKFLQSTSDEPDLKFWDVDSMRERPAPSMRNVDWSTQTCIVGYEVLGAWSNLKSGEVICSLIRSNSRNTLAVGNNTGLLSLYRYPCTAERPDCDRRKFCSGKVTRLGFTNDDQHLIAASGKNAAITQWQMVEDSN